MPQNAALCGNGLKILKISRMVGHINELLLQVDVNKGCRPLC